MHIIAAKVHLFLLLGFLYPNLSFIRPFAKIVPMAKGKKIVAVSKVESNKSLCTIKIIV